MNSNAQSPQLGNRRSWRRWIHPVAGFAIFLIVAAHGALFHQPKSNLQLTSSAFTDGKPIPSQFSCEGKNISPPLQWTGAPAETKSFVLIVDDPDAPAGVWTHWVIYDLPSTLTTLAEDVPKSQPVGGDGKQGINDFKQSGYGGPCPPPGKAHRYLFRLYALDTALGLKPGATKKQVEAAMVRHVIGQAQLMGTYQRK
jgi:Raf kinase inhibitor-like YbhB/YbcL family protein